MAPESVKEFYDRQYRSHLESGVGCPHAVHDMNKASRRVAGALRAFGIKNCKAGSNVLDVGCGLGYYTKALSATGANVTGLDFSEAAIAAARGAFPECHFTHGSWPEDIAKGPQFDLIWTVNFSLINTFDVNFINERLIKEAVSRLKPNGALVIAWNTDFSGRTYRNYSLWSLPMLRKLRTECGLSAPIFLEAKNRWLSFFVIRAALILKRSIPIFMVLKRA